ncbi:serine hydrolase domain-containing protein [Flavitalea sp.]|nr:serine hydrolase domain-containing protein [Flavitalea sp.]
MQLKSLFPFHKFFYFYIGSLMLLITACTKTDPNSNPAGSNGAITSFSFQQSNNSIPVSSTGTINGTAVTVFLPPGTVVNVLKPSFTLSAGAGATVNGVVQQSGITAVDFTKPVTYSISNPDGSVQNFMVTVITDITAIDNNVMEFMKKYNVPGLSISITKDDRLVYSKGYGIADSATQQPVTPSTLFRLASDSKQFTAVTIMKLIDQGKIQMTDKIFGAGAILGTTYGKKAYGRGVTDITVSDLLHHTSGGWSTGGNASNSYNDPMFSKLSMNNQELITWTLDNVPLDTLPNTNFEYSNFGFFLLARVIEKITGQPYAQAVQDLVLTPSGISDMAIAGNTLANRLNNEAVYYIQESQSPYGLNISRADGCAGWIASSVDLVKFMTHIDQLNPVQDIISPAAFNIMTATTPVSDGYASGWCVYSDNGGYEHQGSLPGTSSDQAFLTQLMNPANVGNFSFGVVVNTRNFDANYGSDLDNIFWNSLPGVISWPGYDLFKVN